MGEQSFENKEHTRRKTQEKHNFQHKYRGSFERKTRLPNIKIEKAEKIPQFPNNQFYWLVVAVVCLFLLAVK